MWTSFLHLCWSHCGKQVIMCSSVQCHNSVVVASCYWNIILLNLMSCLFLSKCLLYSMIKLLFLCEGTKKNSACLNINPSCSWLCLKKPKKKQREKKRKKQQKGPRPTFLTLARGIGGETEIHWIKWAASSSGENSTVSKADVSVRIISLALENLMVENGL